MRAVFSILCNFCFLTSGIQITCLHLISLMSGFLPEVGHAALLRGWVLQYLLCCVALTGCDWNIHVHEHSGWLYSRRNERIRSLARGQLVVTLKNVSVMGRLAVGCILNRGIVNCSVRTNRVSDPVIF